MDWQDLSLVGNDIMLDMYLKKNSGFFLYLGNILLFFTVVSLVHTAFPFFFFISYSVILLTYVSFLFHMYLCLFIKLLIAPN